MLTWGYSHQLDMDKYDIEGPPKSKPHPENFCDNAVKSELWYLKVSKSKNSIFTFFFPIKWKQITIY